VVVLFLNTYPGYSGALRDPSWTPVAYKRTRWLDSSSTLMSRSVVTEEHTRCIVRDCQIPFRHGRQVLRNRDPARVEPFIQRLAGITKAGLSNGVISRAGRG
jgi:hypothetical protein